MHLIPFDSDQLKRHGVPFAPSSFYKWRSVGDPRAAALVRLGGRIFLDLDRWRRLTQDLIDSDPLRKRLQGGNHAHRGSSR